MAISLLELHAMVSSNEALWARFDMGVTKWLNDVLTDAATADREAKLALALQSNRNPRPLTMACRWSMAGASQVRGANDPLSATDTQIANEIKKTLDTLALQGYTVRDV